MKESNSGPATGTMPQPRYAIYYAPAETADLHRLGSRWLGYDAAARKDLEPDLPAGLSRCDWLAATEDPRRYGLHATLKPPFRLAEGKSEAALIAKLSVFASGRTPVDLSLPCLSAIGAFLALTPGGGLEPLSRLAGDCVTLFDEFRAPAGAAELARRSAAGLSAAQTAMLERWGYPYVLEEFRFHITLTGRLDSGARCTFKAALRDTLAPVLAAPLRLDSLCLFVQQTPESRFHLHRRFALGNP